MAVDLKSLLRPDETIVYEARFRLRDLVWSFSWMLLMMMVAGLPLALFLIDARDAGIELLGFGITAAFFAFLMRRDEVFVTNLRVIARSRDSGSEPIDLPINEIVAVAHVFMGTGGRTGYVSIRTRSGSAVQLQGGPDPQELCRRIAGSAEVSADGLVGGKVTAVSNLMIGTCLITAFSLIGVTITWLIDVYDSSVALLFLFPVLIGGVTFGFYLGALPVIVLARLILSPAEAQSLACVGHDPYRTDVGNRLDRAFAKPYEWMLSLLYGQKIRCD